MTSQQNNGAPHAKSAEESVLKVGANSSATALAGAISQSLLDVHEVTLRAVGAGAVNQAVKACAIARGHTASRAVDLCFRPGFEECEGDDGSRITVMIIKVRPL